VSLENSRHHRGFFGDRAGSAAPAAVALLIRALPEAFAAFLERIHSSLLGIRGFIVAESLHLHKTGKKLRIVLLGQSCGVQITKRRLSAPLRGT
jgi:hypothetical protein